MSAPIRLLAVAGALLFSAGPAAAAITAPATLTVDTTWAPDDGIVLVDQDLEVQEGVLLTIAPGTTVVIGRDDDSSGGTDRNRIEIHVRGTLVADGTWNAPIVFEPEPADPPGSFQETRRESWWGMRLYPGTAPHVLDYVDFSRAYRGLMVEGQGIVTNSEIHDNETHGLHSRGVITSSGLVQANLTARCNRAYRNGRFGFLLEASGSYTVEQNTVYRNEEGGIVMNMAHDVDVEAGVDRGREPINADIARNTVAFNSDQGVSLTSFGLPVSSDVTVIDSVISENNGEQGGVGILNALSEPMSCLFSCVYGHTNGLGQRNDLQACAAGPGLICSSPARAPDFADAEGDDYRLNPGSPARNQDQAGRDMGPTACAPDSLTGLQIEPAQPTVVAGGSVLLRSHGLEDDGTQIPDVRARWTASESAGGALRGNGLFIAGCETGTFADALTATVGDTSTSVSPVIVPGDPVALTLEPLTISVAAGAPFDFEAEATDVCGNPVPIELSWEVLGSPPAGSIDVGGRFTATCTQGLYPAAVRVSIETSAGTLEAFADVEVLPGAPATVAVNPSQAILVRGEQLAFRAEVVDDCGSVLTTAPRWSVVGGGGTIIPETGVFTAGDDVGSFEGTVRAAIGTVEDFADVTVLSARLASLAIEPANGRVPLGGTLQLAARGISDTGETVDGISVQWASSGPAGEVDPTGLFQATGNIAGVCSTITATVTDLAQSFEATGEVCIPTDFDDDGMPDQREVEVGLDPTNPADRDADLDGDGLSNGIEFACGGDPEDGDTDDDGVLDGDELDPCDDFDGDTLSNLVDSDSDDDGLPDGLELGVDTAPRDTDTARDRFRPDQDPATSTDPLDEDSDGDGFPDPAEDLNGNGRVDDGETDPNDPDDPGEVAVTCRNDSACDGRPCILNVCAPSTEGGGSVPGAKSGGGGGCNEAPYGRPSILLLAFLAWGLLMRRRRNALALFVALPLLLTAQSAEAGKDPLTRRQTKKELASLIDATKRSVAKGQQPTLMFDLDSTLFDNGPRTLAILQEFTVSAAAKPFSEKTLNRVRGIKLGEVAWGVGGTLKKAGIKDEKLAEAATKFWLERFFTDSYQAHDVPYPNAVRYVRALYDAGARIVYLTGRDTNRMLVGTVESLRANGFPIGVQRTELIMKPDKDVDDTDFKKTVVGYLRDFGQTLATFENEPGNANALLKGLKDARHFFLLTNHSPGAPKPDKGLHKIYGYDF